MSRVTFLRPEERELLALLRQDPVARRFVYRGVFVGLAVSTAGLLVAGLGVLVAEVVW